MHATVSTKLSLPRWAQLVGLNPVHFGGVSLVNLPTANRCGSPTLQYGWQSSQRVGREEIAQAIATAERNIEALVNYPLMPTWVADERVPLCGWGDYSVRTRWRRFISGGVRAVTLISSPTITWSDADSDGYKETGTVAYTSDVDQCEIHVFYPGKGADSRWELRPITFPNASSIRFRRELCVKEELTDALGNDVDGVDGLADGNFITTVDVYRVYNDPSTQISFLWEPPFHLCPTFGDDNCPNVGAYETATGYLVGMNHRLGYARYHPATWDADTLAFKNTGWPECIYRWPDIGRLYYRAGMTEPLVSCPSRTMASMWEMTVARYALSMLDQPPCSCMETAYNTWAADLAFTGGVGELGTYKITESDARNPLGTRRGGVYAWREILSSDRIVGA